MIVIGGNELSARYYGTIDVQAVYHGAVLVWEAISSCFGNGMWLNDKAWKNTDGWKNN